MSRTGVVVALIFAVLLALLTAIFFGRSKPIGPATPLLQGIDIALLKEIEVRSTNGKVTTLASGAEGQWLVGSSTSKARWPASATQVRAALRLLGDLRTGADASLGGAVTQITLSPVRGEAVVIRMGESIVGGRAVFARDGIDGFAAGDAQLRDVFARDAGEWREAGVFVVDSAEASRFSLKGRAQEVSLGRVGKQWGLTTPRALPADRPIVEAVLKQLSGIAVSSFRDDADPAGASFGFDAPTSVVRTEHDRRTLVGEAVERATLVQELRVGGPADVAGQSLLCRVEAWSERDGAERRTLWGPIVAVISKESLSAVATDPAVYVSRVAMSAPVADARSFTIASPPGVSLDQAAPRVYRRASDEWAPPENLPASAATPEAIRAVRAVIKLVSETRAQQVVLSEPSGAVYAATVTLGALDGHPLGEFAIAVIPDGAGGVLAVTDGAVWWLYGPTEAKAIGAALPLLLSRAP